MIVLVWVCIDKDGLW